MEIKNSKALKRHNQQAVLSEIIKRQPISRSNLTQELDVSHTTISYLVKDLMDKELVVEMTADSTGGRPPKLLSFKGDNKYIISMSFEERKIAYAIYNLDIELIDKEIIEVNNELFVDLIKKIEKVSKLKNKEFDINEEQIFGIGVSVPGIYKEYKDLVINSTTHYLGSINLKTELNKIFNYAPIYIDNDANLSVYYEWSHMLDKEYDNLIYIYVVDGIGSGIIVNNSLYTGSHGNAGEIGHMKVKSKGKKCICGGQGCLETISSIKAIEDDFKKAVDNGEYTLLNDIFDSPFDYKEIITGYLNNDKLCKKIINRAIKYFVRGLSSIINIFDPQIIVLGGLFDEFNEDMIKKINNKLENSYFPDENDKPKIINRGDQQNYQISAVTSFIFDKWKANF
ncbi:ROK [Halanaerobium saccharolyticum subsp. saccharolyticum DSM 6643]|uniref:ROK n=1 Tax=Halanaerobium saccharolyticum subsp. saccharolyticum DSM 6643 TaxID=1293054 RepID=M5E0C9_9FIRM|nr:ROK family transcriptional regulator [Halanaerobium saccharolyticum]CCU78911.1 ROK [Halanaerobium saccharolyticum subsp. saccharolyticum DSM 6643]